MKKTYIKFLKRSVWRTKARFLAILAIVAIGVGFLSGLLAATPDMRLTVDNFYDSNKVHDIDIKSTLGITQGDIKAIGEIEGVDSVTPGYVTDLLMESSDGSYVTRLYGMDSGQVNGYTLVEGRLPENDSECLIAAPDSYSLHFKPGEKFKISKENKDYDKMGDTYSFTEVTAVGIVTSPLFFSVNTEPSSIGAGSVQLVMYMGESAYTMDVYTDAFVRLKGAEKLNTFTDEYKELVAGFAQELETLGKERSDIRYDEVITKAKTELEDGKKEYEEGKKEAEDELAKAAKKLKDGEKEIADNKKKLSDGRAELETGKQELLEGESDYEQGKQTLSDGRAEIDANRQTLAQSKTDLEAAQTELDSRIAGEKQKFLDSVPALVKEQYNKLKAQIDKAEKDAKTQLDKNAAALEQGEKALNDGRAQIAEKEKELAAANKAYESSLLKYESGVAALNEGKQQLEGAKKELAAQIAAQREQLEANKENLTDEEYNTAKAEIDAAETAGNVRLKEQQAVLDAKQGELSSAKQQLDSARAQLDSGAVELAAGKAELDKKEGEIASGKKQLETARQELKTGIAAKRSELEASLPTIEAAVKDEGLKQIEAARLEAQGKIDEGAAQISEGETALAEAEAQLEVGEQELAAAAIKLSDARQVIADSEKELTDGEKKLQEGIDELQDGKKTYEKEKTKAEKELADAKQELLDAEEEINDIKVPEWLIFDRMDILSFSSYEGDSGKVSAIATIFPIFFFMVAALVALTTMTRLVEEERTQIGVFKALGYSRYSIITYYLGYSIFASLLGSLIGVIAGTYGLPPVIAGAYNMSYSAPPLELKFWWGQAALIVAAAIACTTVSAWAACINQLKERPSSLMQPKAPQAGKRIFLERIPLLWKRFSFTEKITARNIFRYKKRLIMTAFGIAGCTALLVTGFGLRDSIKDISRKQFGEIYRYDASLTFSDEKAAKNDLVLEYLNDTSMVESYLKIHTESGYVKSKSCNVYVPENEQAFKDKMNLRTFKGGEDIPFDENSAVVTQKLSETLGIKLGDTVPIQNAQGVKGEVTVTGVTENYVSDYLYLSPGLYKSSFGASPEYTDAVVTMAEDSEQLRDDFSEKMLATDKVLLLIYNSDIEKSFNDSVKNIDSIVFVLIASAGALAMIVLYNLTNINICERKKELATIKVLGFHQSELAGYIYRETTILCIIGVLAGLVIGIFLHAFVVSTAEVDAAMFGRTIYPLSYIYSAGLTLLFTAVVDVIMLKKLRKIDMVESMKANE